MFCGSASGTLLPPYVCYRAEHLYDTWTQGGPDGTRYNRSKNGWFNVIVFEDWFYSIALPYFKKFDADAPKVLIGDNLSSHISVKIIQDCKKHNIRFVLLPPNSTHYCQPLDAAFFRPLKRKWRAKLDSWKTKNRGPIQKDCFPRLLKQCLEELNTGGSSEKNLIAGFECTGIYPLEAEKVLKQLPVPVTQTQDQSSQDDANSSWTDSLKDFLEEFRKSETRAPLSKPSQSQTIGAKKTKKKTPWCKTR